MKYAEKLQLFNTDDETGINYYPFSIDYVSTSNKLLDNDYYISVELVEDLKTLTNNQNINECALLNYLQTHFVNLTSNEYINKIQNLKIRVGRKFYKLPYKAVNLKKGITFISVNED